MKKIFYLLFASVLLFATACSDDDTPDVPKTFEVNVQLDYPDGYQATKDITITLTNRANSNVIEAQTNKSGLASFVVTTGVYDASATDRRSGDGVAYVLNGILNNITVTDSWTQSESVKLQLAESKLSQLVIKEVFYGGTPKDDGSGTFYNDKYVILYNNSDYPVSLDNVCLAITLPYNPHASNTDYRNGKLYYEDEGWVPAGNAYWYFRTSVTIEPYQQKVVALENAVDNTVTYSQSINFANAEYFCNYDNEVYTNERFYPAPSEVIPTSHYLKVVKYGAGTAWVFSNSGPGFFIFAPKGQSKEQFGADESNLDFYNDLKDLARKKVPVEWVIDGTEIFVHGSDTNKKRLNSAIDAGYIHGTRGMGYSIYRNVDKDATEAIEENEGKIVYSYALGTTDVEGGTTDPSGIDAEASIAKGAKIVYLNTNNSTTDFHQRKMASLRK